MADKLRQEGTLKVEAIGAGKVRRTAELINEAKVFRDRRDDRELGGEVAARRLGQERGVYERVAQQAPLVAVEELSFFLN
jgi:hypothetical protein